MTYDIRQLRDDDINQYLELFDTVFGKQMSREWFDWKYTENPYLDHVPIYVAEQDGKVIGARSFFATAIRAASWDGIGLVPCDTMVHPDHRRQGLFTQMTERALEDYRTGGPDLCFSTPNEAALSGNLELGWEQAGKFEISYRIQRPGSIAVSKFDHPVAKTVAPIVSWSAQQMMAACQSYSGIDPTGTVTRYDMPPTDKLAALHDRNTPQTIHARRDSEWYDWRLSDPEREYLTYLGRRGDKVVSAAVVATGSQKTTVADMLPLVDTHADRAVSAAVIKTILQDLPESEIVSVPAGPIPSDVLSAFGFVSDETFGMNKLVRKRNRTVLSLTDDGRINQFDPTDPVNWSMTFLDLDT